RGTAHEAHRLCVAAERLPWGLPRYGAARVSLFGRGSCPGGAGDRGVDQATRERRLRRPRGGDPEADGAGGRRPRRAPGAEVLRRRGGPPGGADPGGVRPEGTEAGAGAAYRAGQGRRGGPGGRTVRPPPGLGRRGRVLAADGRPCWQAAGLGEAAVRGRRRGRPRSPTGRRTFPGRRLTPLLKG